MRFMVIVKATPESEADIMPTSQELADMGAFNEELIKAGVMLAGEGLKSSRHGARLKYDKGGVTVTDGPFAETKELIAGYWIIEVKSRDEAMAWMKRAPFSRGEEIEMRQIFEIEDFAVDDVSRDALEKEKAWRDGNETSAGR